METARTVLAATFYAALTVMMTLASGVALAILWQMVIR